jgi:hypothetical protein
MGRGDKSKRKGSNSKGKEKKRIRVSGIIKKFNEENQFEEYSKEVNEIIPKLNNDQIDKDSNKRKSFLKLLSKNKHNGALIQTDSFYNELQNDEEYNLFLEKMKDIKGNSQLPSPMFGVESIYLYFGENEKGSYGFDPVDEEDEEYKNYSEDFIQDILDDNVADDYDDEEFNKKSIENRAKAYVRRNMENQRFKNLCKRIQNNKLLKYVKIDLSGLSEYKKKMILKSIGYSESITHLYITGLSKQNLIEWSQCLFLEKAKFDLLVLDDVNDIEYFNNNKKDDEGNVKNSSDDDDDEDYNEEDEDSDDDAFKEYEEIMKDTDYSNNPTLWNYFERNHIKSLHIRQLDLEDGSAKYLQDILNDQSSEYHKVFIYNLEISIIKPLTQIDASNQELEEQE